MPIPSMMQGPQPEEQALMSALGGAESAPDAGPEVPDEEGANLEQIIADLMQLAQSSQDPKIMALVSQLLQLLAPQGGGEGEDLAPVPEE